MGGGGKWFNFYHCIAMMHILYITIDFVAYSSFLQIFYAYFFVHQSKNHEQTNDVENYVEYIINVKVYTQHCNTMTPHQINGLN